MNSLHFTLIFAGAHYDKFKTIKMALNLLIIIYEQVITFISKRIK